MIAKSVTIAGAVGLYWIVSISLVFLNKYLLSSEELKLDAPLFITCFQCFVSFVLCLLLSICSKLFPSLITFPAFVPSSKTLQAVLPLSVVFLAMVSFNNLCLKFVGVSFYFIGRSLTTVFNVVFSYLILRDSTSSKAIFCCVFIIGGFWLGVDQEDSSGQLSCQGVIYGVAASVSVALNAIYTKKVLAAVDNCVWKLTMYNNLLACILFVPFIIVTEEVPVIISFPFISSYRFWIIMLTSGLFGFAMGYVTGLQIQLTSPLTHNVSGTAKSCFQTVLAYVYNQESRSGLWWFSNFTVLAASFAYTMTRRAEMRHNKSLPKLIPRRL